MGRLIEDGYVEQSGQGKGQSEGWGKEMLEWDQEQSGAEGGPG